jgi:putative Mg2+ transporter-C (MgtC) family protein
MPSNYDFALRIIVAMVLGGAVGLERELADKQAGLRTHISVALGCCLFAMVSAYSFEFFGSIPRNDSSYSVDVTRIASNVAAGIGFLGGGAILKHGASVRGLTTAGSLWVTAAIGLATGFGDFFMAAVTTAALLVALVGLRRPARMLERRLARDEERIVVVLTDAADPGAVINAVRDLRGLRMDAVRVRDQDGKLVLYADMRTRVRGAAIEALVGPLLQRDDVEDVEVG